MLESSIKDSERLRVMRRDKDALSAIINDMRVHQAPPDAEKRLRTFTVKEAARMIGCHVDTVRSAAKELNISAQALPQYNAPHEYTLKNINKIRLRAAEKAARRETNAHVALHRNPRRREGEGLRVIACANFKGGSAKTTTSVHLAQYLALRGYRVLLADLDPQASATSIFGMSMRDLEKEDSLYAAMRYDNPRPLRDVVRKTYFDGVDLVSGARHLAEWEFTAPYVALEANKKAANAQAHIAALRQEKKAGSISRERLEEINDQIEILEELLEECTSEALYFMRLRGVLESVENDYDVVVCDTSPTLGYVSNAAAFAADILLATIYPQWVDCDSMDQYLSSSLAHLEQFESATQELLGRSVVNRQPLRFLITRYGPNSRPEEDVVLMLRKQLSHVLKNPMLRSDAIADAGNAKKTLYEARRSDFTPSTYDRAMNALEAVNTEIEELLTESWGRL